jgi:hypothetical protein
VALVVTNGGEVITLSYLVNKVASENLVLCLYKNNVTPGETDVIGTYTEADFTGYANKNLAGASWTVTGGAPTTAAYAEQSFASTAGSQSQDVYGYYLKRASTGDLVYAEKFSDGPYHIANNGDTIKVTPQITGE